MIPLPSLLTLAHLVGMVLAVGAATVKLTLLLKCRADSAFIPTYIKVTKRITRQIVLGLILLTLSGIGWLLYGYEFTAVLMVKVILVGVVWVLGPIIDNFAEPRFQKLAPAPGESASPGFVIAQRWYLTLEAVATLLFYVIIVIWVR